MRRGRVLLASLIAALVLACAATGATAADIPPTMPPANVAPATPAVPKLVRAPRGPDDAVIGLGEQDPGLFDDLRLQSLRIRDVRYVVSWDALQSSWQRAEIDDYLGRAKAVGARVVVAFNISRIESRRRILPSPARYRRMFREFRRRYPEVRTFITWNEANHGSQPTARRPDRVAAYFDVIKRACPKCTVVAADVLDLSSMPEWIHAFRKAAKRTPRIWGLHNYIDANRFRTTGTRALLRATRGQIWFTETGGIVWRKKGPNTVPLGESASHAADAVRHVFRLQRLSRRIRRVYFYHWSFPRDLDRWDSALLDRHGDPRPAYRVIQAHLRASAIRASRASRARKR